MKKAITKIEQLIIDLKKVSIDFPHQQRMEWAIRNDMSLYTVNRYLKGEIGSTIIAEKLLFDINQFKKSAKAA